MELVNQKRRMVRDWPDQVGDTGDRLERLIQGTAVFPGGAGLWRGAGFGGPLPPWFPDRPVMFVGHNFDSILGHDRSLRRMGELQTPTSFWGVLLGYLGHAGIAPETCFFTNALMGLKPDKATGAMPSSPAFEAQCRAFLIEQIRIVNPSAVVALGNEARIRISRAAPPISWTHVMHPSAREFNPLATRAERICAQGAALNAFLLKVNAARAGGMS